jgi:hypothetical protein
MLHTRLITHAEEIAFYGGHLAEHLGLLNAYNRIVEQVLCLLVDVRFWVYKFGETGQHHLPQKACVHHARTVSHGVFDFDTSKYFLFNQVDAPEIRVVCGGHGHDCAPDIVHHK